MKTNMALDRIAERALFLVTDPKTIDIILTRVGSILSILILVVFAVWVERWVERNLVAFARMWGDGDLNAEKGNATSEAVVHAEVVERNKRLSTVSSALGKAIRFSIFSFGFVLVLKDLGFDITPLITGAGVAGVAIGLGSQTLVKDVIGGIFLLLENQIRIGDQVKVGGVSGVVEHMRLRVTVLRDVDGTLHIVPNSEIKTVSNMSYQWGRAVVDIPVAYENRIESVMNVVHQAAVRFQAHAQYASMIAGPVEVIGITEFASQDLKVRVLVKTLPAQRYQVQLQLRRHMKEALEGAGILMMPSP